MKTLQTRLQYFIEKHLAISAYAFAQEIKTTSARVYLTLKENKKPGSDFLVLIAKRYPELNLNWLLTGEGQMLAQKPTSINKRTSSFVLETAHGNEENHPPRFEDDSECEENLKQLKVKYDAVIEQLSTALNQNSTLKDQIIELYKEKIK